MESNCCFSEEDYFAVSNHFVISIFKERLQFADTIMQIEKLLIYDRLLFQVYPGNFTFLLCTILQVFTHKTGYFLIKVAYFFTISIVLVSKLSTTQELKKLKKTMYLDVTQVEAIIYLIVNPFVPNAPFLYPLKTSENRFLMFSGGRGKVHWEQMG